MSVHVFVRTYFCVCFCVFYYSAMLCYAANFYLFHCTCFSFQATQIKIFETVEQCSNVKLPSFSSLMKCYQIRTKVITKCMVFPTTI